ncbi:MAG TPA: PIN domain-containing protein [Myxococcaceae bacterium]|nr:PIN domain-containing protein [Myxococcaceae bacterium]
MRVYVETNFVLELALQQDQHSACEELLQLAEASSQVRLAIPALSLAEPFATLRRRSGEQRDVRIKLERELRELKRTRSFADEQSWATVIGTLIRSSQDAAQRLDAIGNRLLRVADVLPLTKHELADAPGHINSFRFKDRPDALIFASVLSDPELGKQPSCFLNKNTRDFDDPSIDELLNAHGCKLIGRFDKGLAYVQHSLASS